MAGLLLGLLGGLALAAYNPLGFWRAPLQVDGATRSMIIERTVARGLGDEPAALLGLADQNDDRLPDAALRYAAAEVALLRDSADDSPVLAVKLSAASRSNQLEQADLKMESTWNLFWPGRGSLFVTSQEQHWQRLVDGFGAAVSGNGFVAAEEPYLVSGAVRGADPVTVIGASGAFEDARGSHEFWLASGAGSLKLRIDRD
jgi:hypothetical protein